MGNSYYEPAAPAYNAARVNPPAGWWAVNGGTEYKGGGYASGIWHEWYRSSTKYINDWFDDLVQIDAKIESKPIDKTIGGVKHTVGWEVTLDGYNAADVSVYCKFVPESLD